MARREGVRAGGQVDLQDPEQPQREHEQEDHDPPREERVGKLLDVAGNIQSRTAAIKSELRLPQGDGRQTDSLHITTRVEDARGGIAGRIVCERDGVAAKRVPSTGALESDGMKR